MISNKESRVKALSENIDAVIKAGVLKGSEVPKLFGRLEFYDGNVKGLKNQSWCEWNENVMESYS